jgi:virginiamycin B lyase
MNRSLATPRTVRHWGLAVAALLCSLGGTVGGAFSAPLDVHMQMSEDSVTVYQLPAGSRPHVLTAGVDGAVWFSMAGGRCLQGSGNKIGRIAFDGRITEYPLPTADSYPGAIAVGPDRALWFGERSANRIGRMTLDGRVMEYAVPTAVTVTLPDGFARGVECSRQSSYPAEGGIASGPDGALWFTEGQGNQIGRIGLDGQVSEYPLPAANSNPIGIDLGADRALWFIERMANRVGRITTDGDIAEYAIPTPDSFPNAIVAGPDGNLWFTELKGDNIGRITLDGEITEYRTPGLGPVGLAVGPDGALWSAGFTGNEVVRITTDGTITDRYAVAIPEGTPGLCCGVAVTSDGSVWFTATEASLIGRVQLQRASVR